MRSRVALFTLLFAVSFVAIVLAVWIIVAVPQCLGQKSTLSGVIPTASATVVPPDTVPASEATIRTQFSSVNVKINHPTSCSPYNTNGVTNGCTNVGGMSSTTVDQVIALKKACGSECVVTVTGGSEAGHAAGTYSHGAGYKVDLGLDPVLTTYIESFTPNGTRQGGEPGPIYTDRCGQNQYVLASNHWDITVLGSCSPIK